MRGLKKTAPDGADTQTSRRPDMATKIPEVYVLSTNEFLFCITLRILIQFKGSILRQQYNFI